MVKTDDAPVPELRHGLPSHRHRGIPRGSFGHLSFTTFCLRWVNMTDAKNFGHRPAAAGAEFWRPLFRSATRRLPPGHCVADVGVRGTT